MTDMTQRDERGRFAPRDDGKVPVTDLQAAADTMTHLTRIMNDVAITNSLCSQFDVSVTRAVSETPGVKWEQSNVPEYQVQYVISGYVLTPPGADYPAPNRDVRAMNAANAMRDEFRAWVQGHDLPAERASTFLAWLDSLPDERKQPNRSRNLGETELYDYGDRRTTARRTVTLDVPQVDPPIPGQTTTDDIVDSEVIEPVAPEVQAAPVKPEQHDGYRILVA